MKNFKQKNKALALFMAVLMMLSIFTVLGTSTASAAETRTLYLKPNANWSTNARFAAYLTGGSTADKWVSMKAASDGLYQADFSGDYKKVTFVRMNPNKAENTWANSYNKAASQTIPTNGNNCFKIDEGQWSSATGTWSKYAPAVTTTTTLYLKPNANWASNARFAVYVSGGTTAATWASMTSAGNGLYKATVTGNFKNVVFVRMNPNKAENTWANSYNKSASQVIPTNGNNCFTVDEGQWSAATGTWSKYAPAVTTTTTLYLKPNANWASNARFAVYVSGGTTAATWASMTSAGNGLYKATVTGNFKNVVFARMNPNKAENTWANSYNKSASQVIPTNGNNCFTVDEGQWSSATGTWSKYAPVSTTTTLYLKPNANWASNARFAVYVSGGSDAAKFVSMTSAGNGYYKADVTGSYKSVVFVRMNPNKAENSWANSYNKSASQTIPTNGNNCFTVDEGQWSSATGTWSKYAPVSTTTTLYLKPNKNWASNARFAIYLTGGTTADKWVSMTSAGNGYYKAEYTGSYKSVVFARMNPNKADNTWANSYNKSGVQTIPTNGNNCFAVTEGDWNSATGTWSKYGSAVEEATAVIHFMDDNKREPIVAKVGETVKYDIYLKLTAPEVQSYATWTYFNQPVGTKKTANQKGIEKASSIPASCNVLSVAKSNYKAYYTPFDSAADLQLQKNYLVSFGMGSMNSDLSYNMLKTNNGSFTQAGGCLVSTITFTVINPGEVEVFTRMDDAIVDLDNGEVHANYVAVYNAKVSETTKTIYFNPNNNWDKNARFAMYLAGGSSAAKWVSMTSVGNGMYKADLPTGDYKTVVFARMNPNKADNTWANSYNKSASITLPTNGDNYFTMTEGEWSSATGTWS